MLGEWVPMYTRVYYLITVGTLFQLNQDINYPMFSP